MKTEILCTLGLSSMNKRVINRLEGLNALYWTPKIRQCAKVYFQSNGDTEWAEKSTARN